MPSKKCRFAKVCFDFNPSVMRRSDVRRSGLFLSAVDFVEQNVTSNKNYTVSAVFEDTKVGRVFSTHMTWYMIGYILLLSGEILTINI